MKLGSNDEYIIKRIEEADDREAELFSVIMEFGLNPSQVSEIQRELKAKGITVRMNDATKNPGTGDS